MARKLPTQRILLLVVIFAVAIAAFWYAGRRVDAQSSSPPPASAGDATKQLSELKIGERGSMTGYSREKFPHWDNQGHNCNTRELVLKRDGKDVKAGTDCNPTAGRWFSVYDGETWTKPDDVDIDHMVPLGQAWVSGARDWPQDKREQFANDLTRPQLFAVTDNLNQQKSDKAPDQWKPPLVSFWCTYATDWITVKHYYGLTVTTGEKTALTDMLGRCPA
ncbi:HNH endonuclease family protein [Amycolatopsis sp. PS_44_ISF1]|uniref:HNH endonuclease family protein n=1 Tax=Amycolatopsis sp. PS_44_ISF1 TaxID=2974917 RepID=UPI0028DFDCC9|nr:HNH endonuclease family protein [Amycolatopsis sp. PS_44_ISF1]MDT8910206.1 HNH endonuclease family protein [Amycolatopsis sp. PS_44_ISF1]